MNKSRLASDFVKIRQPVIKKNFYWIVYCFLIETELSI